MSLFPCTYKDITWSIAIITDHMIIIKTSDENGDAAEQWDGDAMLLTGCLQKMLPGASVMDGDAE